MLFRVSLHLGSIVLLACQFSLQGADGLRPPQSFRDPVAAEWRAALAGSDVEAVQRLIAAAAPNDCLELDEQGETALHVAVKQAAAASADPRPFTILKMLAARKGCVNAPDRLGREPILELEPLSWASRSRIDSLQILIGNGGDVNAVDENGSGLLHQLLHAWDAASLHWPDVIQILLKAGLNPNLANVSGQTALHSFFGPLGFCCVRQGDRESRVEVAHKVFAMLVTARADLSLKDREGTTPLGMMIAEYEPFFGAKETILEFAEPALAKTLQVNTARLKGRPVLIAVCDRAQGDVDLVERLLALGADPKVAEDDGLTALHGAAWFYHAAVCALLVQRGADVNALNQSGRTPLHELIRSNYHSSPYFETDKSASVLRTAEVLLDHGANRRLKDKDGKTAFDFLKGFTASDEDDQAVLKALRKMLKP